MTVQSWFHLFMVFALIAGMPFVWRIRGGMWNPFPGRNFPIRAFATVCIAFATWYVGGFELHWIYAVGVATTYWAIAEGHAAHIGMGTREEDHGGQSRERLTFWLPLINDRYTTDFIGLTFIGAFRGLMFTIPLLYFGMISAAMAIIFCAAVNSIAYALAWGHLRNVIPDYITEADDELEFAEFMTGLFLGTGYAVAGVIIA